MQHPREAFPNWWFNHVHRFSMTPLFHHLVMNLYKNPHPFTEERTIQEMQAILKKNEKNHHYSYRGRMDWESYYACFYQILEMPVIHRILSASFGRIPTQRKCNKAFRDYMELEVISIKIPPPTEVPTTLYFPMDPFSPTLIQETLENPEIQWGNFLEQ